jgi:hypothetical protein
MTGKLCILLCLAVTVYFLTLVYVDFQIFSNKVDLESKCRQLQLVGITPQYDKPLQREVTNER